MDTHDWHPFDIAAGLEVRQTTGPDEANRWEARRVDEDGNAGEPVALRDDEFEALRGDGPNPKGL